MIRKVARLGHPALRQVAEPVPPDQIVRPAIQQCIDDMMATMYEYDGAEVSTVVESIATAVVSECWVKYEHMQRCPKRDT